MSRAEIGASQSLWSLRPLHWRSSMMAGMKPGTMRSRLPISGATPAAMAVLSKAALAHTMSGLPSPHSFKTREESQHTYQPKQCSAALSHVACQSKGQDAVSQKLRIRLAAMQLHACIIPNSIEATHKQAQDGMKEQGGPQMHAMHLGWLGMAG